VTLRENTYLIEKNEDEVMFADISELMQSEKRLSKALSWKPFNEGILDEMCADTGFIVSRLYTLSHIYTF